jgi:G:T-mismatch repair DNA endonuclease (very short patch repair protein)
MQEAQKRAVRFRKQNGSYRHTQETIAKLSESTANQIAAGTISRVSQIEDVVAQELTGRGLDFVRQFGIRNPSTGRYVACVDFYLPAYRLAIEVNGTFWHADPRFYDRGNLAPAQRRTIERYSRKVNILSQSGIKLAEIWEHDLKQSVSDSVDNALAGLIT